ncbi:MAG TPA: response regulator [Candidatus Omnitrophota bacterium]|nr:response regulator [Candidatus Omnitrophota bacterium]
MGKRILIIDDETDVVMMLMYRLKASRYEVIMAATGKEGIQKAETQRPDLILLDYKLPDISSAAIVERLKFSS